MKRSSNQDAHPSAVHQPYDFETTAQHRHLSLRLWLRLLSTSKVIENEVRERLRIGFEETIPRFDLMTQLYREPNGLRMGDLSARLMVSNGNITGIVTNLVADRLVEGRRLKSDRRSSVVRLTKQGRG